jgi:two-component system, NtrC family, sensor kinase
MPMPIHTQSVIIAFIGLGAIVMGLAIHRTRRIMARLKRANAENKTLNNNLHWRILSALMSFFLLGYCLAVPLVVAAKSEWLTILTGIVFFFGAVFVLFSVMVYDVTLQQLIGSQIALRAESDRTAQALTQLTALQHGQMLTIHTEKMRSLGQMSAGIAHEINNPINFIHGNLEHLRQYATDLLTLLDIYRQDSTAIESTEDIDLDFIRSDLFKTINSMQKGTQRICAIVKSMRNFSRLDESQYKFVSIIEDIESTLMMLQGKLEGQHNNANIQIKTHYDASLPPLYCDHAAINQCLLQILSNAIESFTPQNGFSVAEPTIVISTQQTDAHWAQIIIEDNGIGIAQDDISRVFEPFFTTKPIGQGTGLGLSTSYQIVVEQHHGQLLCRSQPHQGTTLTIKLPIRL